MSATITVSNSDELFAALSKATGGETILMKGGEYGAFNLNVKSGFDYKFPSNVTIASADPNDPAVFSRMTLNGAANLTIEGVKFDYTFHPDDAHWTRPFALNSCTNVKILNSVFDGDNAYGKSASADGFGWAYGLSVKSGTGNVIEGNESYGFMRGFLFEHTNDVTVTNNDLHGMRIDGMNFIAVQGALIEGNFLHDFRASYEAGDHRDMIQFWTNGTKVPSTDVIIRGNTFDIGAGSYTQTIFMRNEEVDTGRAGAEMFYRNFLIEDNQIYNGHLHGISVGEIDGLVIRNNTLVEVKDANNPKDSSSAVWTPAININKVSKNVVIENNAVSEIRGFEGQTDWSVKYNAFIQNNSPFSPGYYDDVFIGSTFTLVDGRHALVALPGGMIEQLKAGADANRFDQADLGDRALYTVASSPDSSAGRVFDASLTAAVLGDAAKGAIYTWTFEDGSTAQGMVVSHVFATGGRFDATLVVTLADGSVRGAASEVPVRGADVITFDAAAGAFARHSFGETEIMAPLGSTVDGAIHIGAAGTVAEVSRGALSALSGNDDFSVAFTLQGDGAGNAGEVFRVHGSMIASVRPEGHLSFQIFNSAGKGFWVSTTGFSVNDGRAHDLELRVKDGVASISVDGQVRGETAFAGTLPTSISHNLTFGNPWGSTNFAGKITAFEIDVNPDDYTGVVSPPSVIEDAPAPVVVQPEPPAPVKEPVSVDPAPAPEPVAEPEPAPEPAPKPVDDTPPSTDAPTGDTTDTGTTAPVKVVTSLHQPGWDGYVMDIASMADKKRALYDDAAIVLDDAGAKIVLDGNKDYVDVGRFRYLEQSERVAFSVDFTPDDPSAGEQRLVWNHMKLGLTLLDGEIRVQAATADGGFKAFGASGVSLSTDAPNRAVVMLDAAQDRLQVVLNDQVVIDVNDTDFAIAGGRQWGWTIGTAWNRFYDGEVSDFRLGDRFDFLDGYQPADNALLS